MAVVWDLSKAYNSVLTGPHEAFLRLMVWRWGRQEDQWSIRCGLGVGNALSTGPYSVFFTSFDTYTTNFVFESFWSMISGSEVLENFELWRLKLSV